MSHWDVFHADRLELVRGLATEAIRTALARGELRDDDLVRPAGTTVPWARLADFPELMAAPAPIEPPATSPSPAAETVPAAKEDLQDFEEIQSGFDKVVPPPERRQPTELPESLSTSDVAFPVIEPKPGPAAAWAWGDDDEDEDDEDEGDIEILEDESELEDLGPVTARGDGHGPRSPAPAPRGRDSSQAPPARWAAGEADLDLGGRPDSRASHVALPVVASRDRDEGMVPGDDEEDPDAGFSLSRPATQTIEELDLAPMVDVAFQLVLFFMVTATTVLYKTLEIPKPSGETPAPAVAQGRNRSLDDLKDDYILVEIDERGSMKLDREPIEPVMATLVEQLRTAREKTGRKSMLLSADFATPHRNAVLAYDAANEIGLGIAIARPKEPQGPAPPLRGTPPARKGAAATAAASAPS